MANPTVATSFEQFKEEFSEFVEREKELAKAELVPAAKSAGIGAGLLTGAGVFALHALWMLLLCAALAVGWLLVSITALSPWGAFTLAFLIVAIVSLVVALVLAKIGQSKLKQVRAPKATIAEATATFSALSNAARGKRPQFMVVLDESPGATRHSA